MRWLAKLKGGSKMKLTAGNIAMGIIIILLTLQIISCFHEKELAEAKTESYLKGSTDGFNRGYDMKFDEQRKKIDSLYEDIKSRI